MLRRGALTAQPRSISKREKIAEGERRADRSSDVDACRPVCVRQLLALNVEKRCPLSCRQLSEKQTRYTQCEFSQFEPKPKFSSPFGTIPPIRSLNQGTTFV